MQAVYAGEIKHAGRNIIRYRKRSPRILYLHPHLSCLWTVNFLACLRAKTMVSIDIVMEKNYNKMVGNDFL